jgi:hypothetical protein
MRPWRAEDRAPFSALDSEPTVQRYLSPLARSGSGLDAMLDRIDWRFAEAAWGFWALEERASGKLVGLRGVMPVARDAPFGRPSSWAGACRRPGEGRGLPAGRPEPRSGSASAPSGSTASWPSPCRRTPRPGG